MIQWSKRTPEIANLLNPAFCALVIYATIFEHHKKIKDGLSFPLLYLILPIILHAPTRRKITARTNMVLWLQRNPDLLIGFPERAHSLVSFTQEAIEYLLYNKIIIFNGDKITISKTLSKAEINKLIAEDPEVADCLIKSTHIARWFVNMKSEANIYAAWGVKP